MTDADDFGFDVWDDVAALITHATMNDERSLQAEIGPSGLGTPCVRKLAHRLLNTPPVVGGDVPWRPTVGKAVHTWLEGVLQDANARELETMHSTRERCKARWCDGEEPWGETKVAENGIKVKNGAVKNERNDYWHKLRYMTEWEVPVGTINGREITGHIDVYDRMRESIYDWKIAGPSSLKTKRAHGMGPEYRIQQHTYGRGVTRVAGLEVRFVACVFLPMNGELRDGFVDAEPFDPAVAAEAFRRARIIEDGTTQAVAAQDKGKSLGAFLAKLKTADDYCSRCLWFSPGATNLATACPGDPSLFAGDQKDFEGLL